MSRRELKEILDLTQIPARFVSHFTTALLDVGVTTTDAKGHLFVPERYAEKVIYLGKRTRELYIKLGDKLNKWGFQTGAQLKDTIKYVFNNKMGHGKFAYLYGPDFMDRVKDPLRARVEERTSDVEITPEKEITVEKEPVKETKQSTLPIQVRDVYKKYKFYSSPHMTTMLNQALIEAGLIVKVKSIRPRLIPDADVSKVEDLVARARLLIDKSVSMHKNMPITINGKRTIFSADKMLVDAVFSYATGVKNDFAFLLSDEFLTEPVSKAPAAPPVTEPTPAPAPPATIPEVLADAKKADAESRIAPDIKAAQVFIKALAIMGQNIDDVREAGLILAAKLMEERLEGYRKDCEWVVTGLSAEARAKFMQQSKK